MSIHVHCRQVKSPNWRHSNLKGVVGCAAKKYYIHEVTHMMQRVNFFFASLNFHETYERSGFKYFMEKPVCFGILGDVLGIEP